jgi:hypothetical protein
MRPKSLNLDIILRYNALWWLSLGINSYLRLTEREPKVI